LVNAAQQFDETGSMDDAAATPGKGNDVSTLTNSILGARLREVREDLHSEHGAQFMADDLNLPVRTWLNYEKGIVVPARVLLEVLVRGHVNPQWLLSGEGMKYDQRMQSALEDASTR
jgi:hypothetical protein